MILATIEGSTCRACGRAVTGAGRELSRHSTSEGVVVWVRCSCGAFQARVRPEGESTEQVVAAGGPDRPTSSRGSETS